MIFLVFLALLILGRTQNTTSIIAIQNTDQIFISYVPYTPCPLPNNTNIVPGSINYTLLNPSLIIESLQRTVQITFWQLVRNGIAICANSEYLLMNGTYAQIVYYNSTISSDFSTREFILTSFTSQGNIVFTFGNAQFYSLSNITLTIAGNITTNFNQNVTTLVQECVESGNSLDIIYIGNDFFLALCPNTTTLFSFNPYISNQPYIFNFNQSIQSITPNPSSLLSFPSSNVPLWNAALLQTAGVTCSVCFFNFSTVTCHGFQEDITWLQTITSRIWGLQQTLEQQQALIIMSVFPQIKKLDFQGTILSVFRIDKTVYVQSANNQQVYLTIFDGNKLLFNTSIIGNVLFYGKQNILLEDQNGTLYIASFTLPYTTITNDGSQQPQHTISLVCEGYVYNQTFDIFWTNIQYPTAIIIPLNDETKTSTKNLYTIDLNEEFQVIGPAFQVFVMDTEPIQISIMDAAYLKVANRISAIFQIQFLKHSFQQLPFMLYFISKKGQFKSIHHPSGRERLLNTQPCGFEQIETAKKIGSDYLIKNTNNQYCTCQSQMKNCNRIQPAQISSFLQKSSFSHQQRIQILQLLHDTKVIYPTVENILNYQLYNLMLTGVIINIYADGLIDMVNLQGETLNTLQSNCTYNTTNGLIYMRNFYDNFFFVLCQGSNTITQYYIRNNTFIFNRVVPLWGFVYRKSGNILSGTNYIFMQVDLSPSDFDGYQSQNLTSCCVLRIDPTEYTVSMIAEIVQVQNIVLVESVTGVDIAYYNSTNLENAQSYLKVYFQDSWISFRQIGKCNQILCPPVVYSYNICFYSLLYNFASSFNQSIVFDTSQGAIDAVSSPLSQIIFTPYNSTHYISNFTFNFTQTCGPIMQFSLDYQGQNNSTYYQIAVNEVVTRNKMLNQFSSEVIQVIDLGQMVPGSSFASYIMVVQTAAINFYMKFNGIWLDLQLAVNTPLINCLYFLYSIQNSSSVKLASNCYNLKMPTQLLTLLYVPSQNSSNITVIFGQIYLPAQLRNVKSIPQINIPPLIFGLGEGPSKSITGILNFCQQYCNQLLINAKIGFLIDYDVILLNQKLLVVGLDLQNISLWINPSIPTINTTLVPSNTTIPYTSVLGQSCDTIAILYASSITQLNLILSCVQNYHQITVDFPNSNIQIIRSYKKYLNCDPVDRSKPSFNVDSDGKIDLLIVGCMQNKMIVKTQEFQAIQSSTTSIITAYLQIYTPQGPKCGQVSSTIRILPLAITLIGDSYILYTQNGNFKLLYQEIDGLLVDSFINIQPSAKLSLIQLSKQQIFPKLRLKMANQYYSVSFQIPSFPTKSTPSIIISYIVIAFFILTNVFTIFTLFCWFIFKKNKRSRKILNSHLELRQLNSNSSQTSRPANTNQTQSLQQDETSSVSSPINSPQVKRVTEIELFEPRYKPSS